VHVTDKNATYIKCHQNAVVFALSTFQYIQLSVAFSGGAPYRKPFYKSGKSNVLHVIAKLNSCQILHKWIDIKMFCGMSAVYTVYM